MGRATAAKPINGYQLSQEIGGDPPLHFSGDLDSDDEKTVSCDTLDDQQLRDALDAHVADPSVQPPPGRSEVVRDKAIEGYQDLKAVAKDTSNPTLIRRVARDTCWALRGLYAELRDEEAV